MELEASTPLGMSLHPAFTLRLVGSPSSTSSLVWFSRASRALGCPRTLGTASPQGTKQFWRCRPWPPPSPGPFHLSEPFKGIFSIYGHPRLLLPEGKGLSLSEPIHSRVDLTGTAGPLRADGPALAGMLSCLPSWSHLHCEEPPPVGKPGICARCKSNMTGSRLGLCSKYLVRTLSTYKWGRARTREARTPSAEGGG